MKRRARWIMGGSVPAVLAIVVLRGLLPGSQVALEAPPAARLLGPLDTEMAVVERVEVGVGISGTLDPYRVVEVRAQLPGTITLVAAERGEPVRVGQLLARYDDGAIRSSVMGAEAAREAAAAAAESAERDASAAETLYALGGIAERDLRQAVSAAAARRAELLGAEARLAEARDAAAFTRVTAPINGVVSQRAVSAGEAVAPGRPLFTVVAVDTLELAARVPAHELARIGIGQQVVYSIDAYQGRRFEGYVSRIDPVADPATRQVTVFARLPNPAGELVGGLHAVGRILQEANDSTVTVSVDAIRGDADEAYVLTVEEGIVTRIPVELGPRDPGTGRVAVQRGLEAGTRVLVGAAQGLEPGSRVEHRQLAAPAPEVAR
jgi:membrane fusion protein, multidrug efflux system